MLWSVHLPLSAIDTLTRVEKKWNGSHYSANYRVVVGASVHISLMDMNDLIFNFVEQTGGAECVSLLVT
jgi:hypothetical protein